MNNSKLITLISPKGGVGKTIISLNLATALALEKKKTILLDLDLRAPQGTHKLMDIKCKYSLYNLANSISKFKRGERHLVSYVARHNSGLFYLPGILKTKEKFSLTPEVIRDFLLLLSDNFEYVIIDGGSELTDQLITILDSSNLIGLVLSPDIVSIYQNEWIIDTLQSLGYPIKMIKTILNRAESKGGVSVQEIKVLLNSEIISLVPSEGKAVGYAVNKGCPVVIDSPRSKISQAFAELSKKLIKNPDIFIKRKDLHDIRVRVTREKERKETILEKNLDEEKKAPKKLAEEEDAIIQLKKKVQMRLLDEMDLKRLPLEKILSDRNRMKDLRNRAKKIVTNIISQEAGGFISSAEVRAKIIKEILDEALGLGPLEDLLNNDAVTEVMVNNKDQVFIEEKGRLKLTTKKFISNNQVRITIERVLAPLGRRIDESVPYVDARLKDGSRVNAIIPPLSLSGPTITIRKFSRKRLGMNELIKDFGSLSEDMGSFLKASVESRKNILVSGGTGSGKTTFLNILSSYLPEGERIVTIEDSAELQLHQNHWIRLESRPPNIEGKGAITIRELFRNTLRMRPDRIVVGECRGQEVLDMLQAMNTGHDGSMTTIHANSPRDVLIRLDSMILMSGVELPLRAIREMISSAIDLIVHTARLSDGSRKITRITEIAGMVDETHVNLQDIFNFRQTGVDKEQKVLGDFVPLGNIPTYYDEMKARGIELPRDMFIPED
ncbi:MAG: Flp pilus assembly complex ATPase component TadA [Candidatus Omnitrophica bacterium]|nr:Flp pilus assembly complex ATPase component TadA [Candidatus Omnitrophota bacterium]MCF7878763.1 Flp pilus assembly complex ATPase component TadA [Candidatus Omnitrophota bacterium]MCF7892876.1 Flp pilus assembly complex ATPase component TadA [Candidatus Omnitrophota bacterium]